MDLDELEWMEQYVTSGPWDAEGNSIRSMRPASASGLVATTSMAPDMQAAEDNAAFISALRNAASELIADAKRYRWLRDKAWSVGHSAPAVCMVDESGRPYLDMDNFAADPIMEGRELDLNIDAAIAKEKQ